MSVSSYMLVFPAGSSEGDTECVDIQIIDDDKIENNEEFSVQLDSQADELFLSDICPSATVNIQSADSAYSTCSNTALLLRNSVIILVP